MKPRQTATLGRLLIAIFAIPLCGTAMPAHCQANTGVPEAAQAGPLPAIAVSRPAFNLWVVKARYDEAARLARTASRGTESDIMEAVRAYEAVRDVYRGSRYSVMAAWEICNLIKRLKHPPKHISALASFIANYPQSDYTADALWALISHLNSARDYNGAEARYQEFVQRFPNNPYVDDILYSNASRARRDYNFPGLIQAYENLLQLCPDSDYCDNGYYYMGSTYYSYLDDYEQGFNAYMQLVHKYPYSDYVDDCLYGALSCLIYMDEIERAVELYNQMVTTYPASYAAARGAGRLARYVRNQPNVLVPNPNDALAVPLYRQVTDLYNQAAAASYMRRYAEAAGLYQRLLRQFPTSDQADDAVYRMAGCFEQMHKYYDRAKTAATPEEIADVERDWAHALGSGRGVRAAGQIGDAVRAYLFLANEYVGSDLRDDAMYKAAGAYETIEHDVAALVCYLQLIKRFPHSRYATTAVSKIHSLCSSLKKPADKIRVYMTVAETYPEHRYSDDYVFQIGLLHLAAGDTLNARVSLQNYLARYSQRALAANAMFLLGRCYQIAEKPQVAADSYRKIIALYPNSGLADDALIELRRFSAHGAEEEANLERKRIGVSVEKALKRSIRGHDVILRPHVAVVAPFEESVIARAYNLPDILDSAYSYLAQCTGADPGKGERVPIVLDAESRSLKAGPPVRISTRYCGEPPAYATCFEPLAQLFMLDPSIAHVTNAVPGLAGALARFAALRLDHRLFMSIGEMDLGAAASTAHAARLEEAQTRAAEALSKHIGARTTAKTIPVDAIFGMLLQITEWTRQGPGEAIDWAPVVPLFAEAQNVPSELRKLTAPEEKAALLLACVERALGRDSAKSFIALGVRTTPGAQSKIAKVLAGDTGAKSATETAKKPKPKTQSGPTTKQGAGAKKPPSDAKSAPPAPKAPATTQ